MSDEQALEIARLKARLKQWEDEDIKEAHDCARMEWRAQAAEKWLTEICNAFSDYEDECPPEQLVTRYEALAQRKSIEMAGRFAAESLIRDMIAWLNEQQGRKGVWLAAIDDFRERSRALLGDSK